jgi:hypothetical protein
MAKDKHTSAKVASIASRLLRSSHSSHPVKRVAGSDLSQRSSKRRS